MQPIIKWSGSKRSQTEQILSHFPKEIQTYYEPFIGGGSVLYGVLKNNLCNKAIASDICKPLIDLWNIIISDHNSLIEYYCSFWNRLQIYGQDVYYESRDRFNADYNPLDFFCINRTCFNGLVRFSSDGKFNVSFHLTRNGIEPRKLKQIIKDWLNVLSDKVTFLNMDYEKSIESANEKDFVYFDPPYAHTKGMYGKTFDHNRLFKALENLNNKNIKWLLSFDGNRYPDMTIPENLYKNHYLLDSGNSSFSRLKNKQVDVKESLYSNF